VAIFLKDPSAVVDYAVDWQTEYLAGQTIIASEWHVAPVESGGLAVVSASHDAGRSQAMIGGGRRGAAYRISNRVTFSDGRNDERSLDLRVEDR
jgi:hypothetical protein